MLRFSILFSICCSALFLVSCQKEPSEQISAGSNDITGNYKFVSLTSHTIASDEISVPGDDEKEVTISNYTTKENSGTINITSNTMTSNNLSYSIDTLLSTYSYINGVLSDSSQVPFQFTVPASSSTSTYSKIGSDSLYFASGSMFMNGSSQQTSPSGAKFKVQGNLLILSVNLANNGTQNYQGQTVVTSETGTAQITLQKM